MNIADPGLSGQCLVASEEKTVDIVGHGKSKPSALELVEPSFVSTNPFPVGRACLRLLWVRIQSLRAKGGSRALSLHERMAEWSAIVHAMLCVKYDKTKVKHINL